MSGIAEAAIYTGNLTKYYGKKRGIIDVTMNVMEGEITAVLVNPIWWKSESRL